MNKLQKFLKRRDTRTIAKLVYKYHTDHGLPQDRQQDYYWALEFYRLWWDEYVQRKIWEGTFSRLYPRNIMTLKSMVWNWLDRTKYGYIPDE